MRASTRTVLEEEHFKDHPAEGEQEQCTERTVGSVTMFFRDCHDLHVPEIVADGSVGGRWRSSLLAFEPCLKQTFQIS